MASNSNDKETMTKPKVKMQDQACQFDSSLLEGKEVYSVSFPLDIVPKLKLCFSYLPLKIDAPTMCDACTSVPR